jgi:NADH-quinone oxidoreductase subunit J
MIEAAAFYLFSAVLLLAGFLVITARNPVHSVLFLILSFFNAAGLFVMLGRNFWR